MSERTMTMATLDFVPSETDPALLNCVVTDTTDRKGFSLVIGSMMGRVAVEHPELYQRFRDLMGDCMKAAVVEMFGEEAQPFTFEADEKPS